LLKGFSGYIADGDVLVFKWTCVAVKHCLIILKMVHSKNF